MFADIVPLTRLPRSVGFFTYAIPGELRDRIREGTIVTIRFRGRKHRGCVWRLRDRAPDGISAQPIEHAFPFPELTASYRALCAFVARDTAVHCGTILHDSIPSPGRSVVGGPQTHDASTQLRLASIARKRVLIVDTHPTRVFTFYRERIAHARKVKWPLLILFPTHDRLAFFLSSLPAPTRKAFVVYHAQLGVQGLRTAWTRVASGAVIVVGTRSALFAPAEWGEIIVDDEDDRAYKQEDQNPRYSSHRIIGYCERTYGTQVTLVSATPRVTTWAAVPPVRRSIARPTPCGVRLLDMRAAHAIDGIVHESLYAMLREGLQHGGRVVLFVPRKGYAGSLLCRDCGYTFACPRCGRLEHVEHDGVRGNTRVILSCPLCGTRTQAPASCPQCRGILFDCSGLGTQKIEESIQRTTSDTPAGRIVVLHDVPLSGDTAAVSFVGIVSVESLLHIPDLRAHERAYAWCESIRQFATAHGQTTLTLQSWTPDQPVIRAFVRQEPEIFYTAAIRDRRARQFPPYARTALIFMKARDVNTGMRETENLRGTIEKTWLTKTGILIDGPFLRKSPSHGTVSVALFLRQPLQQDERLFMDLLNSVPDAWLVDREPESIF